MGLCSLDLGKSLDGFIENSRSKIRIELVESKLDTLLALYNGNETSISLIRAIGSAVKYFFKENRIGSKLVGDPNIALVLEVAQDFADDIDKMLDCRQDPNAQAQGESRLLEFRQVAVKGRFIGFLGTPMEVCAGSKVVTHRVDLDALYPDRLLEEEQAALLDMSMTAIVKGFMHSVYSELPLLDDDQVASQLIYCFKVEVHRGNDHYDELSMAEFVHERFEERSNGANVPNTYFCHFVGCTKETSKGSATGFLEMMHHQLVEHGLGVQMLCKAHDGTKCLKKFPVGNLRNMRLLIADVTYHALCRSVPEVKKSLSEVMVGYYGYPDEEDEEEQNVAGEQHINGNNGGQNGGNINDHNGSGYLNNSAQSDNAENQVVQADSEDQEAVEDGAVIH